MHKPLISSGEGDAMTDQDLDRLEALLAKGTQRPWAWEWIAEKSNEWAVGQVFRVDPKTGDEAQIAGHFTESDDIDMETVIERRACVGLNESGNASAADADIICDLVNAAPALIDRARRLREIEKLRKRIVIALGSTHARHHLQIQALRDVLTLLPESDAEPVRTTK